MACSATARALTPAALASRMPLAPSNSLEYWSMPELIDCMNFSLPACGIRSFFHMPETGSILIATILLVAIVDAFSLQARRLLNP